MRPSLLFAAGLAAGCGGETYPTPPGGWASTDAVEAGGALFAEHCAICHGPEGNGQGQRSASLSAQPPDFHNPSWQGRRPAGQVFEIVKEGKQGTSMPAWVGTLSDEEIWQVTAWVKRRGGGSS